MQFQAMNFFGGLLLLLMPEENAFWQVQCLNIAHITVISKAYAFAHGPLCTRENINHQNVFAFTFCKVLAFGGQRVHSCYN